MRLAPSMPKIRQRRVLESVLVEFSYSDLNRSTMSDKRVVDVEDNEHNFWSFEGMRLQGCA
ncbi:MAG: hypothetical protein AAFV36_03290 [Myxococcota bacterium]